MSKPQSDDFPVLTNEDVKLLYRIITLAESSNDPPFRALFASYDQVLAEYGIEADHDRIYFRFLLRMGEAKTEEEGLFKRFETLLWKHGIQIDFGEDESDYDPNEPLQTIERVQDNTEATQDSSLAKHTTRRSRRSSLSSIYDTSAKMVPQKAVTGLARSHSFDDMPSLQTTVQTRVDRPRKQRVSFSETAQERLLSSEESVDNVLAIEDETDKIEDYKPSIKPDRDLAVIDPAPLGQLAETEMIDMAKKLRFHQLAARAIRIFRHWRDSAQQSNSYYSRMDKVARQFDADSLQERVIDYMRGAIEKARQRHDSEKFYNQLEHRASTARDLFLLTKAFTHWAQSASDEVLRTSAARRHILRTRYFNAWRDITVVNELKVRRQKFKKFFAIWRQRTYQVTAYKDEAAHFRRSRLVNTYYQQWFWNYCAVRAPGWYDQKATKKLFQKWLDFARTSLVQKQLSNDFQRLLTLRRGYAKWIVRSDVVQHNFVEADLFRRRTLLAPSVEYMRKEVGLSPTRDLVKRNVDSRIARTILREWIYKTRISLQAAAVNDLRIMRNTWTTWNDRLRCLALSRTIDDRNVLESLYKWLVAARFSLFERLRNERVKRHILNTWSRKTTDLSQSLRYAEESYKAFINRRLASSIFRQWLIKNRSTSRDRGQAEEFHIQHLKVTYLQRWADGSSMLGRLDTWANDARFYVLVASSLGKWSERTVAAKKTKRREGFSYMRRKTKASVTGKLFTRWREATTSIQELSAQAQRSYQQRLLSVGGALFDRWCRRTTVITSMNRTADELSKDVVLRLTLRSLAERLQGCQSKDQEAARFFEDVIGNAAARALRRLNWQVFQNQSRRLEETAQSLLERNARKHHRSMLRYWAEKAAAQRQMLSPSNRLLSPAPEDEDENEGTRFGQSIRRVLFDGVSEHVPATPAYLATPSRRTGRARNRFPAPMTPATTQITPFLSRLRGPSSALDIHSAREARRNGIDDIPESSPLRGDQTRFGL